MASHYVTFRYNGNGTGVSGVPSASTSYFNNTSGQYPYTVYKKLGSAPSRNYYKFKGWARSSGSSSGSSAGSNYSVLIPTADTSSVTYDFYATWEHVNVTCTFNANGGSGAPRIGAAIPSTFLRPFRHVPAIRSLDGRCLLMPHLRPIMQDSKRFHCTEM